MTASSQARLVCTPGHLRLEGPLTTHSVGSIWAEALAALAALGSSVPVDVMVCRYPAGGGE